MVMMMIQEPISTPNSSLLTPNSFLLTPNSSIHSSQYTQPLFLMSITR